MADPTDLNKFPRELTDGEFKFFQKTFPNLVRDTVTVLGPKDQKYNCISYSLGFTDRWIDVGSTKPGLATLYAHYFYEGCDTAEAAIDVYANATVPKHAAKVESSTTCSSKMQVQSTLRHPRQALEGNNSAQGYGEIYGHFKKNSAHPGNNNPTMPGPDHPNNHELPPPLPVGHPGGATPIPVVHPQPPTTLHAPPQPTEAAPHVPASAPHTAAPAPHATPPAPHAAGPGPYTAGPAPHTGPPHTAPSAPHATAPHATAPHVTTPHGGAPSHPTGRGRPGHSGFTRMAVKPMAPYEPLPPPADEAVVTANQLHASLKDSYGPAVANFETLFDAWKATWNTPEMQLEPNSSTRAEGPAYNALVKLGPAIIPLVVQKLADPSNFFAIHLYNALEQDEEAKVDPENVLDHNVVQRQANLIVDMNHARATAFAAKADAWAQHQEDNSLSANSADYVSGDAYQSMVTMGPSIIGYALEKYAKEPSGWWHEMLHEIVHGQKGGPGSFFKDRLHRDWRNWFENGLPHEAAPKMGSTATPST